MTGRPIVLPDVPVGQELCPFCKGRGVRVVPPPALTRGGRRGGAATHGYASTYANGCRCELCRAAWRESSRRQRVKKKQPPVADCPSCHGRGWFGEKDNTGAERDVRCPCWETRQILKGNAK